MAKRTRAAGLAATVFATTVWAATVLAVAPGPGAAAVQHPVRPANPANDKLEKLSPAERAAVLARAVGHWCIGTRTFLMGVVADGQGRGNAYWSLGCADGTAWAVQVDRAAGITAIDCATFKANGAGKECFKKF